MKLLLLFASPHEDGPTRQMADAFLAPLREDGRWAIQEFAVFRENPHPCTACGFCARQEGCAYPDLDGLDRELRSSDLLVIASPVYNAGFPAPMKALVDRWQRYYEARFSLGLRPPIAKHREAVLLLTRGSPDDFGDRAIRYQLERCFTVMNTALAGSVTWGRTDAGNQEREAALRQARELALVIRDRLCYN